MTRYSTTLEHHFAPFRAGVVGQGHSFDSFDGSQKKLVYADWTASGRLYNPIEHIITNQIGPLVANTHTESNVTGTAMTLAYREARDIIKKHVNAREEDVLISGGSGMTALINKLQRILGLRIPEAYGKYYNSKGGDNRKPLKDQRPVVFTTHMEHHSNHTSWVETIADVVVVPPNSKGLVCPSELEKLLETYKDRPLKIGSFTACSNVTGIITPYHKLAQTMHKYGGYCIVDFAASAPYVSMDMHPKHLENADLDALVFSPHKFLGGPGSSGILIISKDWYTAKVPDSPGGGTVDYTNPWGDVIYTNSPELREDGGTPPFLQTMRAALAIRLKESMGVTNILRREEELRAIAVPALRKISGLKILDYFVPADSRLGIISFAFDSVHFNLLVHLLNDRFGIQVRGGCSCAGTYGHHLFNISKEHSYAVAKMIAENNLSAKPGWVRLSLHPIMTNQEVRYITNSIAKCVKNYKEWKTDYSYDPSTNDFMHKNQDNRLEETAKGWFVLDAPSISIATKTAVPRGKKRFLQGFLLRRRGRALSDSTTAGEDPPSVVHGK